ncbi:MAG TPA: hypothetical protein VIM52_09065 [Stellaceae bacterium]
MTAAGQGDRDLAAIAAALLDQGRRADALSRLVTVAALFALMLLPTIPGRPPLLLPAVLGPVALLGLGEAYLAMRVGFDAALFRRLAAPAEALDLGRLDEALLRLGLIPPAKTGRPIAERIAGARRLLQWQGLMLGLQAALILTGAGFAVLRGQGGG